MSGLNRTHRVTTASLNFHQRLKQALQAKGLAISKLPPDPRDKNFGEIAKTTAPIDRAVQRVLATAKQHEKSTVRGLTACEQTDTGTGESRFVFMYTLRDGA